MELSEIPLQEEPRRPLHAGEGAASGQEARSVSRCARCRWRCKCCLCAVAVALLGAAFLSLRRAVEPSGPLEYSQERAVQFAKLAGAAYCSAASLEAWRCGSKCFPGVTDVKVCAGSTTQAFVGLWEGHGIVSFEGTHTVLSMVQDLRTYKDTTEWPDCKGCSVHTGFLREWTSLRSCVEESLDAIKAPRSGLRVTGHSLGAAVSSIAMVGLESGGWHVGESYNFGSPRAGDERFTKSFDELLSGRYFRVTHHMDPVPHVPPYELSFRHTASEVFYEGTVNDGHVECTTAEDSKCAAKYSDIAMDMLFLEDHSDYMGVQTGSAGCEAADPVASDQPSVRGAAPSGNALDVDAA